MTDNNNNTQQLPGITFTGDITVNGPLIDIHDNQHEHVGLPVGALAQQQGSDGYTDAQVARALEQIVGDDGPINKKWKWAGAYWWLRWACYYPVDPKQFCTRIGKLPFSAPLNPPCDYGSIRNDCTLTFMEQDPRRMDEVQPRSGDREKFVVCREVAMRLDEALRRTARQPSQTGHSAN